MDQLTFNATLIGAGTESYRLACTKVNRLQERSNAIRHDRAVSSAMLLTMEGVESHLRAFYKGHSEEVVDHGLGRKPREAMSNV